MAQRTALVCGAGGFIGSHLVKRLKGENFWVRGIDLRYPEFSLSAADEFIIGDLRDQHVCGAVIDRKFDQIYQLAADMGGAGYIFTGEHDADVMHNSAVINLNIADRCRLKGVGKLFYSSSACVYPAYNQKDPTNPKCSEDSAYPADPDSEYGWEKLFSERLFLSYKRNYDLEVRIARYHNIFGPEGAWHNGKEKAPAAICRKVAAARNGGEIEIWGDGKQTRSFLFIDECIEATRRFVESSFAGPLNIGSEEMVSIEELVGMAMRIAGKKLNIRYVPGPVGVRGRNSDNAQIRRVIGWVPSRKLIQGLSVLYPWIEQQVKENSCESKAIATQGSGLVPGRSRASGGLGGGAI